MSLGCLGICPLTGSKVAAEKPRLADGRLTAVDRTLVSRKFWVLNVSKVVRYATS